MAKRTMKVWECDKCGKQVRNKFATYVEHNCKETKSVRSLKLIKEENV